MSFALSITHAGEEPFVSSLADFIEQNRGDPDTLMEVLSVVSRGETYRGGGGAAAEFEVRPVGQFTLTESDNHGLMQAEAEMSLAEFEAAEAPSDVGAEEPDWPDLTEMVDAIEEIVAASDHYAEAEDDEAAERCRRAVQACRDILSQVEKAREAYHAR